MGAPLPPRLFVSTTTVVVVLFFLLTVTTRGTGGSTCHASAIASIFANTCKFRRSHPHPILHPIYGTQKVRIGSAEVLDILTNGDDESEDGAPSSRLDQDRRKKETEQVMNIGTSIQFLTNELPPELMEGVTHGGLSLVQEAKWWKRLMRAGSGRGGKVRRNVGSTLSKCCSHVGCTESDFLHLC